MLDYYDDVAGESRWLGAAIIGLLSLVVVGTGIWTFAGSGDASSAAVVVDAQPDDAVRPAPATSPPPSPAPVAAAPAPTSTSVAGTTTAPPTTAADPTTTPVAPTAAAPTAAPSPGYPTSDDGTPLPVIVTYDTDLITITGFVPSVAAKERLELLATANSKTPARLEDHLVVNEDVPIGVGVRVIELNSVRFPEGSADILPAHATELERVATVMEALPNITVLVVGHADQRGDAPSNYAISAARAAAVVDFLTYLGVAPTRMSSRAVGESDLLTLADDGTALALNRRTEFVFYGVLAG